MSIQAFIMVAVVRDELWNEFYAATNPKDPKYKRLKEANTLWREKNRPVVIRDSRWDKLYSQTNPKNPEEMRIKEADVLWIVITNYEKDKEERKSLGTKFLKELPKEVYHEKPKQATCQAVTISNKPCKFKPVSECGRFCKKHLIV